MEQLEQWFVQIDADMIVNFIAGYGVNLMLALAILIAGKWTAAAISKVLQRTLSKRGMEKTLTRFLISIAHALMLAFVIIAALSQLGIETTSIAAIFAAAGLAIGLALQGLLANFASGFMIIAFKPFKAGDFVEAGGASGTIQSVSIFNTTLHTPDNKKVIVPNASITSSNITNFSANDTRRIDMVFGIGYDDDIRKAKALLRQIVDEEPRILDTPETVIGVSELADNSVNFVVRPWVKRADYWDVYLYLQETVKLRFDEAGISIPYPQRDVHLHTVGS